MTILSHQEIKELCIDQQRFPTGEPLIEDHKPENIRTAGYDLRLGDTYYLKATNTTEDGKLATLSLGEGASLSIPPNQVVITSTQETLNMPHDLVGHLSLKLDLVLEGLIMPSQSQIDAGYRGSIFVLLYNLYNEPVILKRGQSVFRLEFARLGQPTELPYRGSYAKVPLGSVLKKHLTSSLRHLEMEFEKTKTKVDNAEKRISTTQVVASLTGVAVLLLGTFVGFLRPYESIQDKVSQLEARVEQLKPNEENLARRIELERQVQLLNERVAEMEVELSRAQANQQ